MTKINWAILGCGNIAKRRIIPGLRNSKVNRLAAIVSRDKVRAAELAQKYGAEKHSDSYEGILADPEIDVIYIGTPNAHHAGPTITACRAGKHVFCDKPMALTIEDCEAMILAAEENNVKLGIGFNNRYNPVHQDMKRRIATGQVGDIEFVNAQRFYNRPRMRWRLDGDLSGGGVVNDTGIHYIDLLRHLLGSEVARVNAFMDYRPYGKPIDSSGHVLLEFVNGTMASLHVSSKIPFPGNLLHFYGTNGSLIGTDTVVSPLGDELPPSGTLEMISAAGSERKDYEPFDIFWAELEAFGQAITNGAEPDITGIDGLLAQEVVLAMQVSMRDGRTVKLR